jgi:hypothetical protein
MERADRVNLAAPAGLAHDQDKLIERARLLELPDEKPGSFLGADFGNTIVGMHGSTTGSGRSISLNFWMSW